MFITAAEARKRLADIEMRFNHGKVRKQEEWRNAGTWYDEWGGNVVSERDEDYVFDALYDVPNR